MARVFALLVLATSLAGCSSVYMKGTPLYTGEYSKPQAPAEDRVNLWPLAYYHDPALSVLWPLGERTDDHVAARPLFSVYKLDKERHQYNVLWPLSQFDFDRSRHYVVPFFWGGGAGTKQRHMGMFPILWYWPGDRFFAFPVFWWGFDDYVTVFPLLWYDVGESFTLFPILWIDPGDHYVVFPLFWYYPEREFSALFPLYTWDWRHNGYDANFFWPLIHAKKNDEGRGWRAGPLAGDYAWDNRRYRFLLWPLAHEYSHGDETTRVAFPLYFGNRDGNEGWDLVPPLFFRSYEPKESLVVSPLYSSYRKRDDAWRLAFPFFFQSRSGKENMFVTPLVGRKWSDAHSTWSFIPALSLFSREGDAKSMWLLGPVSHFNWGGSERTSHVFPLYFYDDEDALLSLPYSWFDCGASRDHWFFGPLAGMRTGGEPRSFAFPFYYHDKATGRFISLPYSWFDHGASRDHWFLGPLAGMRTGESQRSFVFPLYYHDKTNDTFISLPYSWFDYGAWREHWFLGPLAHVRTGKDPRSFAIPFYYYDKSEGTFLSLPYSHTTAGSHHRDHWFLGPLAGFRTGAEHRSYLFPLYMADKASDTFITLPLSIQSGEKTGFVNVAGPVFHYGWYARGAREWHAPWPLVGGEREIDSGGFHAWPLWWRKAWDKKSRVKGGALWPLVWYDSSPERSKTMALPLFSTSRRSTRIKTDETDEREYRHRRTWVLPTFTYDRKEWNPPVSGRGPKGPEERQFMGDGDALGLWVRTGCWPFWRYEETDKVAASRTDFSLLGWLYDSKRIANTPEDGEQDTYLRRRILWRAMHYERRDGRTTLDVFPFITHDREPDTGFRKTSFAWRLFRHERGRDGSVKTDILFLPVWRGEGDAAAD